tara:strand:- start:345 stop:482 length:138 start_codon:yes stop_codon:yes gene_type:complete
MKTYKMKKVLSEKKMKNKDLILSWIIFILLGALVDLLFLDMISKI